MSTPGGGPGLTNLKFLVVDDHAQIRSLVRTILFALGARNILDAADGGEGLKVATESEPDIVIVDWAMEPMSGIDMVKAMRQSNNDKLKYIPIIMLTGPGPAARKCLDKAGLTPADIDLWEINEAFASVVLRYMKDLDLDLEITNVNGGAIAMGHPLGATGGCLVSTVLDELERRDAKRAMLSLCVGGGMGISTIIERIR